MTDEQKALMTPEMAAAQFSIAYREDTKFRAAFDKDPKAAISQLLGQDLSPDVEVVVHRSKAGQVHVVVPDGSSAMGDEQLESVSGGRTNREPPPGHYWDSFSGLAKPYNTPAAPAAPAAPAGPATASREQLSSLVAALATLGYLGPMDP